MLKKRTGVVTIANWTRLEDYYLEVDTSTGAVFWCDPLYTADEFISVKDTELFELLHE